MAFIRIPLDATDSDSAPEHLSFNRFMVVPSEEILRLRSADAPLRSG